MPNSLTTPLIKKNLFVWSIQLPNMCYIMKIFSEHLAIVLKLLTKNFELYQTICNIQQHLLSMMCILIYCFLAFRQKQNFRNYRVEIEIKWLEFNRKSCFELLTVCSCVR